MSQRTDFDVVVIGGGPAGTATALTLRHYAGLSVAVMERSGYDLPRIGETLSPGLKELLTYLKVWEIFARDQHQTSYGTSAAWGNERIETRDFIFSPFGTGWHLDRQLFDRRLAEAVEQAGGVVWRDARLLSLERREDRQWDVRVTKAREISEVRCRFVVDATGRRATVAASQGVSRRRTDRLIGIVGTIRFPRGAPEDTFTLIESGEAGWWYSATLPSGNMLAAFMTDADLARMLKLADAERWQEALAATLHTSARLKAGSLTGATRTYAADSARLSQSSGDGWIAVGDASASHDPLSASGIARALSSGARAAIAIHSCLRDGDSRALHGYDDLAAAEFATYHSTQLSYYRIEQRWPASAFWSRRQADPLP